MCGFRVVNTQATEYEATSHHWTSAAPRASSWEAALLGAGGVLGERPPAMSGTPYPTPYTLHPTPHTRHPRDAAVGTQVPAACPSGSEDPRENPHIEISPTLRYPIFGLLCPAFRACSAPLIIVCTKPECDLDTWADVVIMGRWRVRTLVRVPPRREGRVLRGSRAWTPSAIQGEPGLPSVVDTCVQPLNRVRVELDCEVTA